MNPEARYSNQITEDSESDTLTIQPRDQTVCEIQLVLYPFYLPRYISCYLESPQTIKNATDIGKRALRLKTKSYLCNHC